MPAASAIITIKSPPDIFATNLLQKIDIRNHAKVYMSSLVCRGGILAGRVLSDRIVIHRVRPFFESPFKPHYEVRMSLAGEPTHVIIAPYTPFSGILLVRAWALLSVLFLLSIWIVTSGLHALLLTLAALPLCSFMIAFRFILSELRKQDADWLVRRLSEIDQNSYADGPDCSSTAGGPGSSSTRAAQP